MGKGNLQDGVLMSKYEGLMPVDVTRSQQEYMNELEEMCKTCEKIVIHQIIARTLWAKRTFMEKYFYRRGFHITFDIDLNCFIMLHDQNLERDAQLDEPHELLRKSKPDNDRE